MTIRLRPRLLAPAVVSVLMLTAGLSPAQALQGAPRALPAWGVVGGWGHSPGQANVTSIASTSLTNAFAVGSICGGSSPCTASALEVQRWNGTKWLVIAPPTGLTTATTTLTTAVAGASAASNAWVFAMLATPTTPHADALRWNGKQWSVTKLPAYSRIATTAVFSSKNAWAFGTSGISGTPYNIRYNGTKWQSVALPGDPQTLSALAANDIWAIGPTKATATMPLPQQKLIAMHWNGASWQTLALPKVSKPAGDYVTVGGIVALGPKNVWEAYGLGNFGTCCLFGGLEHWNGAKWQAVSVPIPVQSLMSTASMAQDGHGGIWMLVRTGSTNPLAFYHLNSGHWSQAVPPTLVNIAPVPTELSWIPGTRLLYAGGTGDHSSDTVYGVILSNGQP